MGLAASFRERVHFFFQSFFICFGLLDTVGVGCHLGTPAALAAAVVASVIASSMSMAVIPDVITVSHLIFCSSLSSLVWSAEGKSNVANSGGGGGGGGDGGGVGL